MPADLRAHMRYPDELFRAQSALYTTYHMDAPDDFYHREDQWQIPSTDQNYIRERFEKYSAAELTDIFEKNGLPYAPIKRPQDLMDDPHLLATGGLAPITLPNGEVANTVLFPFTLDGQRMGVRHNPPTLGQHSAELLQELGYSAQDAIKLGAACA